MSDVNNAIQNFQIDGELIEVGPYGTGHINDTYCAKFKTADGEKRFIHQRINHNIFTKPEEIMDNIDRVTKHLRGKIEAAGGNVERETLNLIPTMDGSCFYQDPDGNYWRTYIFIEGARTYDVVEGHDMVFQASRAFGEFQKQIADIPGKRLYEAIPNFHNTKARFETFLEVLEKDALNRAKDVQAEIEFVKAREADACRLVNMVEAGELPERLVHQDTKFNNVMIDDATHKGICVIDLDTVGPGVVQYDFGDSVRIGTSTALEDEQDLSKVSMDIELFEVLAKGYLDSAREFLTKEELAQLAFSGKLLTFECGTRFLTDHLQGDTYFKIHRENHNLDRCRTQFKMVAEIERQMDDMEKIIEKYSM